VGLAPIVVLDDVGVGVGRSILGAAWRYTGVRGRLRFLRSAPTQNRVRHRAGRCIIRHYGLSGYAADRNREIFRAVDVFNHREKVIDGDVESVILEVLE